ncbi:spermine synthase-like [Littorina saxatilis]|uniref:spermine synthase-like n=1 Tax=Littorina saxatilis TaxID=31220 RepID=UPI0038B6A377
MGTNTVMLAYQLRAGVKREDVSPIVPDLLSLVMNDVTVVYPSSELKATDGLVAAVGNSGKSHATLCHHSNGLLTLDVQHECESEEQLHPLAEPHTFVYIRTLDNQVESRLGDMCEKSVSVVSVCWEVIEAVAVETAGVEVADAGETNVSSANTGDISETGAVPFSFSIFVPIRRPCRLPRNYAVLADDRLVETDYTHAVCDVMSPFQRISIMQSRQFGRVLLLDDDVMFGESDEIYVTTVLGLDRGNNFDGANVLILGGGDGGILYTLTSLPKPPRHVLMAEIDDEVMKACRKYMRSICGHVMDKYKTESYEIQVRDCVEVLKESLDNDVKYDYVINDLTEFSVEKGKYDYDFKTNNALMELSFKCLKDGGKYLARGNCTSDVPYLEKIEKEFRDFGVPFQRFDKHVPSFRELYCFFEAQKANTNGFHNNQ